MGIVADIRFDQSGWVPEQGAQTNTFVRWAHEKPISLMMSCLGTDPHLRSRFGRIDSMRGFYRAHFQQQGFGIVGCDETQISGYPAVWAIGKRREANKRHTYVGTLALPLPTESYVFSTLASETDTSGDRIGAAVARMRREGHVVDIDEATGEIQGWAADPYDGSMASTTLYNPSDEHRYDEAFPDHPLSLTRSVLNHLVDSVQFGDQLQVRLAAFEAAS